MHNNYYFLRQLSHSLDRQLAGTVVSECFSQNREELVIRFETATVPFFIKANLDPAFSCLSFPNEFHRARKNSIDLFPELIGRRVTSINECRNERSFVINFSDDIVLLFKMHGNRSNIILFGQGVIKDIFRTNIIADHSITLNSMHRDIDFSYETFVANIDSLPKLYFTFGKVVWSYLDTLDFSRKSIDEKWELIKDVKKQLEQPGYFLCKSSRTLFLSLLRMENVQKEFDEPLSAVNEFFYSFVHTTTFDREKEKLLIALNGELNSSQNFILKTGEKLREISEGTSYKLWADLLMANLHQIRQGTERVSLPDFNTQHPVEIKLKKELSPQKNAELFYKKAKNQHIEIEFLRKAIDNKQRSIEILSKKIDAIGATTSLRELRAMSGDPTVKAAKEKKETLPYFEVEYNTFRIWVGRNAEANDALTLKYSYKDDLWLHAKDVPGSHVLIKFQAGKKFPKEVIERAAQLAAYYSKRKNESLCPVTVTPKKFVRKRKGDPAGMVVVEREDVLLVEPKPQ